MGDEARRAVAHADARDLVRDAHLAHANVDALLFETTRVGSYPAGVSPIGCHGMIGDVWEWTSSDFVPWPGYETFPYAEYSEVFFGADYKVLKGGSWATRPGAIRGTNRVSYHRRPLVLTSTRRVSIPATNGIPR